MTQTPYYNEIINCNKGDNLMTSSAQELSYQRKSALAAGIALIVMALAAFFSYGYVHSSMVVQGDASATYNNIMSSNMLFKAGILGWLIILISDIVVHGHSTSS